MDIILYLLQFIQYQHKQICWLINLICRYIPLKQWAFDDSHSPKYQKFKIDELPKVISYQQDWNWKDLISYYQQRYHKTIRPIFRRVECDIPKHCTCPACDVPVDYLMWNDGRKKSQVLCKVCQTLFSPTKDNRFSKNTVLRCPHCNHSLVHKKDQDYGKNKYKLHYIYHEFTIDFFKLDLNSLTKNASSLKFTKFDSNTMSLCLTLHVNLGLSLRKTKQALKDLYNIDISHQSIANYCKSAAMCIKPFVVNYDYGTGKVFTADETYIKIRGVKAYIWFIMDASKRSIIGNQVSDNRGVGPCILAMRMAFRHLKKLPENFHFIADCYSAYPLAAQQFFREFGDKFKFEITQVIGLTNDDEVSKEFRPYKQMIERLNRTYKASYRKTNGFDNIDGANYDLALWVAYYNFLRPHKHNNYKVLNEVEMLSQADTMLGKWQLLLFLGQQTILNLQHGEAANCS